MVGSINWPLQCMTALTIKCLTSLFVELSLQLVIYKHYYIITINLKHYYIKPYVGHLFLILLKTQKVQSLGSNKHFVALIIKVSVWTDSLVYQHE